MTEWSWATRISFRFVVIYFGLYVLATQMIGGLLPLPIGNVPSLGELPPLRNVTEWTASRVFRANLPLVITGSGSGDKTFDWVQAFCLLSIAALATMVWSILARRRPEHSTLHRWFALFLRFAVGSTLVAYGAVKVVPLQMPAPSLTRLLQPFGNFSPMGVLWFSVGSSFPYEIFTGCVELLAGVLLFVPRTATAGALLALAATTQVFVLNMTYDVPVKLFSFHLVVMSLVLLAPHLPRLAEALAPRSRLVRWAVVAQLLFGAYIVGMSVYGAANRWNRVGAGGAPKSPLYGIWNVDEMIVDGQPRPPLLTDRSRWRRVIFQSTTNMSFQAMGEGFVPFGVKVDETARTVTLTRPDKSPAGRFTYERPRGDRLIIDGEVDGHTMRLATHLVERESFLLVNRGFHWVQEYPFNR